MAGNYYLEMNHIIYIYLAKNIIYFTFNLLFSKQSLRTCSHSSATKYALYAWQMTTRRYCWKYGNAVQECSSCDHSCNLQTVNHLVSLSVCLCQQEYYIINSSKNKSLNMLLNWHLLRPPASLKIIISLYCSKMNRNLTFLILK